VIGRAVALQVADHLAARVEIGELAPGCRRSAT